MKSNPIIHFAMAAGVFLGASSLATLALATPADTLNTMDVQFVKQSAADGKSEVKLAKLAVRKTERTDVKELAETLIRDHKAANAELAGIAKTKGVDVSAVIDTTTVETFQDLERRSGKEFDAAFLSQLQKSHESAISAFESESQNAKDGAVKSFAESTLPTLKSHLGQIKALLSKQS